MKTGTAHLISFGLGGHTVELDMGEGYGSSSISGYDTPERFERELASDRKSSYPPLAGVPVVDERAVLEENPGLAISSPMVNAKLPAGAVRRFAEVLSNPADSMVVQAFAHGDSQQQGLAAMAVAAATTDFGGLDYVAPDVYLAWWQARGARIGRMDEDGRTILWQD